jgi:hypothetical protein
MSKNSDFEKLTKNIDWNRLLFTVIPLLKPFIIFGAWVIFARMNTKASVTSKLIAIAEVIPAVDLGVPKEIVLASLYDFTDDTIDLLNAIVETVLDPVGIQATKDALNAIKELALEGETTATTDSGFGFTVTVDDLLKYVGLDDDIIKR